MATRVCFLPKQIVYVSNLLHKGDKRKGNKKKKRSSINPESQLEQSRGSEDSFSQKTLPADSLFDLVLEVKEALKAIIRESHSS